MITKNQMACGFYPRENFPEDMDEESRLRTNLDGELPSHWIQDTSGRTVRFGDRSVYQFEAESAPRDRALHGNWVEDAMIHRLDSMRGRGKRNRSKKRRRPAKATPASKVERAKPLGNGMLIVRKTAA